MSDLQKKVIQPATCARCGGPLPPDGGYGNVTDGRRCCTKACVRILVANDAAAKGDAR